MAVCLMAERDDLMLTVVVVVCEVANCWSYRWY